MPPSIAATTRRSMPLGRCSKPLVDKPKKHSGMISESGRRFVKEGPLDPSLGATLALLENLRDFADYTL